MRGMDDYNSSKKSDEIKADDSFFNEHMVHNVRIQVNSYDVHYKILNAYISARSITDIGYLLRNRLKMETSWKCQHGVSIQCN